MDGQYRHDFTESLEAVARGLRGIDEIADPELREAVRTALGLPGTGPGLDAARRARIRRLVLAAAPQRPRASDRAFGLLSVLAAPAPYAVRALGAAVLCAGLVAGTLVASADSLPDDALYGVKLASERLRLAVAVAPEDRAAVELSLAEHRLSEAERLAGRGSESGALIATSAYAAHLASAAAELSQIEAQAPRAAALVAQLESKLAEQRGRAEGTALRLLADPRTAVAGAVLGTIASTPSGTGATAASRIAQSAAAVSARVSAVADRRVGTPQSGPAAAVDDEDDEDQDAADEDAEDGADRAVAPAHATPVAARRTAPQRTETPKVTRGAERNAPAPGQGVGARRVPPAPKVTAKATPTARAKAPAVAKATAKAKTTARPTVDPSARIAAEKARESAEKAKRAAERAKHSPKPKQPVKATPSPRR